ncbi:cupin domain-containing protein [Yinghuangia sp. ASG 101]|uniref:cupin domain-containing protein n=1 Tax=Yinghuangia sp. ASG 101 TaxID=2896848 RepID=UPI001E4A5AF5|nr:cupin domain-containing protein [Yinghuangia sp. ASG 101]UGQ09356.1 cupin domain-containing protein [Yinghuangia sp. ASG 101]
MAVGVRPYLLEPGQGLGGERAFLRQPLRLLTTGQETGQALTLSEQRVEHGFATPLHVHHIEDESFYVVAGEVDIACGDERWRAVTGSFAFLPHSVPHAFRVVSDEAVLLRLSRPAGFEEFAAEVADVESAEENYPRIAEAAHRAGYEVLGPPPF